MALSGRLNVSGYGAPVPVRVERPDGSMAALTTAAPDGSWSVDVPDGRYVVRPRWMDPFTADAPTNTPAVKHPPSTGDTAGVAVASIADVPTEIVAADAGPVVWVVRYGDTARSPIWAVLDATGSTLDLTGWTVRAQARASASAPSMIKEWTVGAGVTVGTATVELPDGSTVTTSTIQLHLTPGDYRWLPRTFTGVFDVEIELPGAALGDPPSARYTVVPEASLRIVPDVTRADE